MSKNLFCKRTRHHQVVLSRLTGWLLCCFLLYGGQALSQSARINLQRTSLARVAGSLQQQFPDLNFSFDQVLFEKTMVEKVQAEAGTLNGLLNVLKEQVGLHALVDGKNVTLKYVPLPTPARPPETNGTFSGRILAEEDNTPIRGATVRIGGKGGSSDDNGRFSIPVPVGTYEATVSALGFGTIAITEITIKVNETFAVNVSLKKAKGQLAGVTIESRKIRETGSVASVIDEIRQADAVVSGISKEQISRSQDRDASEVIRRISGVSIIQNRMVVIRGLSQRYNPVMLDGLMAPSFEPDSRAFSFDILPSPLIDRIMIYKTAVPELPGDFAGGVIKVHTTEMPVKNAFNVSYSASYNPYTTFKEFREQHQGNKNWLGYDDGTYSLPKEIGSARVDTRTPEEKRALTAKFADNWDIYPRKAPVDHRFNLDFAKRFTWGKTSRLGIIGAFNYANTYRSMVVSQNTTSIMSDVYSSTYKFSDQTYDHGVRLNGMLNLSLDINKDHRISFKTLYTHMGNTNAIYRNGETGLAAPDGSGLYENQYVRQYILSNSFKGIYTTQLSGKHTLNTGTQINWTAGYTKSKYDDPDQRYRTLKTEKKFYYHDSSLVEYFNGGYYRGRRYTTLPEEIKTAALDVVQPLKIANAAVILKAGFYLEDKERRFEYRQFNLENDDVQGNRITEIWGAHNSYNAQNDLKAVYLAAEIPFTAKLKLYGGLRIEDNTQKLQTYSWQIGGGGPNGQVNLHRQNTSKLPSFNLNYSFTEKNLLRAAYSKTLNRPEFREISTFYYMDFMTYRLAYGNEKLKIQTDINNLDLRFEHYPGTGEIFTAGIFYKKFKDPVEFYYYNSTSGRNSFQWNNAVSATNYGAEVELMLGMHRYFNGNTAVSKTLRHFSVLLNATYIYSKVDLGGQAGLQDKNRPLMGQSPYLINAGLNYTNATAGLKLNANYNRIGKRLTTVGNIDNANVYEMPRNALDLSFSQLIGKLVEIKGGVQNVLNSRFLQIQQAADIKNIAEKTDDTINGDNIFHSFYTGPYITLGIGLKL